MPNRFELFTFLITSIHRSIHRIKSEFMDELGLMSSHVPILYYLTVKGPMSITELAEMSLDDKANISRAAVALEKKGLVARNGRGRRLILSLTEEGQPVGLRIRTGIERVLAVSAKGLSEEERAAMYSALSTVNENLNAFILEGEDGAN